MLRILQYVPTVLPHTDISSKAVRFDLVARDIETKNILRSFLFRQL